jgi:hypothetical protein
VVRSKENSSHHHCRSYIGKTKFGLKG